MIAFAYETKGNHTATFRTIGCGCCSDDLYLPDDREEIIQNLKTNYSVLLQSLDILGMTISDLQE